MNLFQFGRSEEYPSQYLRDKTAVTIDTVELIIISVFAIVGISYYAIVLGYSKKRSVYVGVKVSVSLLIGCLLMLENFGQLWEFGSVRTRTPYRAGEKTEIDSEISLKVGLRSVNITLHAITDQQSKLANEIINYNERFSWTWDQGVFGFGLYAGRIQRSFLEAQERGLPVPILWIAEYFTIDGEGIRFGRFYRTAGWYCHILLWTAFFCWILANVFLQSAVRYASYCFGIIGILQITTCIIWIVIRNPTPLVIPFENGAIRMQIGQHFWMTCICGLLCLIIAAVIFFMDLRFPNILSSFLGIDPLNQYDECVIKCSELEIPMRHKVKVDNGIEMEAVSDHLSIPKPTGMIVLKRRSTMKNAQKALFRQPVPVQIDDYEDIVVCENKKDIVPMAHNREESTRHNKPIQKPPLPKKKRSQITT